MTDPFLNKKQIFSWNVPTTEGGDAEKTALALVAAGISTLHVKAANGNAVFKPNAGAFPAWKKENVSPEFVQTMHARGISVVGWGFNFGHDPDGEGRVAAQQVDRLDLDGWDFDVESTFDNNVNAYGNAGKVIGTFKKTVVKKVPTCFCSWAYFNDPVTGTQFHPKAAANLFMSICDYGMPMMYWGDVDKKFDWSPATDAVNYFNRSLPQWQRFGKPIIPAGRAYTGDGGTMHPDSIKAFATIADVSGCPGVTWWTMDNAYKDKAIWAALTAIPGGAPPIDPPPVEPPTNDDDISTISVMVTLKDGSRHERIIKW